ncbi:F-box/FBD/LRR-repeat protein At1g13570-like [Nicotiana sylvestris]|uniref:F-box/FBD/LRR-repeat protein At1g13570-like n=2 Tax=Nicotiana TaxID=4085 RepID=A0A1S3XR82_TOBAC|nr:PREDICTED: F-box/FBD/LRR-repeat protein At1g13570-like [Nicotiana sylvestris]XP_016442453.1 PREDICTED: F-box/FBD/LRR-repeat protein At1g13570-like [Nicotiana tabacum]
MMSSEGKRHCCLTLPSDVLSNLPENVIDGILMCLPFKDAVRTSILSDIWRYKWCRLPELTLDKAVWTTKTNGMLCPSKISIIIYHILMLHVGPITKFILHITSLRSYLEIDDLIYFLSKNGIQHLVLTLPFSRSPYKLPVSFFKCLQLRYLTLRNCLILPPPNFKGFDRLISLELRNVTISSKFLESLISKCLLLEQLVLRISEHLNSIEIKAPKLRSFDFKGNIKFIILKDVPRLAKLSLANTRNDEKAGKCDIAKFLESFTALEHLYLGNGSIEFFAGAGGTVLKRFPFIFNCVKRLYLSDCCLGELEFNSCVVGLIRSFPCLQYLEIEVLYLYVDGTSALQSLEVEHFSDVTFNQLKEVNLKYIKGSKPLLQLMKLLLAKSPVLVRMLIDSYLDEESAAINICATELSKFQRASPKAEVVFIKQNSHLAKSISAYIAKIRS